MTAETSLPAEFVIGGLWEGAPVLVDKQPATVIGGLEESSPYIVSWYCRDSARFVIRPGHLPGLSLRLPGPLGLGLAGLEVRVRARVGPWWLHALNRAEVKMPRWFGLALSIERLRRSEWPWLSRYLVMTDALAAARGWPVGEGAPVYGWKWHKVMRCWLLTGGHPFEGSASGSVAYGVGPNLQYDIPALEDITDPMEALEAAYRSIQ